MRIFILLMLAGFTAKSQADFSYSISGTVVDFAATNPTGFVYEWNFDDGNTDTMFVDSTQHTYASSGSYLVKMRVFDTTFLLLDSAEKTVNIETVSIEERNPAVVELKGNLYTITGEYVGRLGSVITPGIYILVGKGFSKKVYVQ